MSNTQRLVFSIIEFLNSELESNSTSEDGRESLEVVIECLERVYNISLTSASDASEFHSKESLKEIFDKAVEGQSTSKFPTDQDKIEAERLKAEGNELVKQGKCTEAVNAYSKAIERDWTNAVYLCNRAAAYSKLGQHEQAVADCKEALQLDPKYGKAYGRLGMAYMALEKYKDARDCYAKAVELDPSSDLYKSNLKTAEDKLKGPTTENPFSTSQSTGMPGGGANLLSSLFSNPGVMNMAQQFLANPQMQQMMTNMMGGMGGAPPGDQPAPETNNPSATSDHGPGETGSGGQNPGGPANIFQFATQMAEQLQQTNPDLVNNLRETMQQMSSNSSQSNEEHKDPTTEGKQ